MRSLRILSLTLLSVLAMQGSDDPTVPGARASVSASVQLPPVLKTNEPVDSGVVMLPGTAPAVSKTPELPMTEVRLAPPPPDSERPVLRRPQHEYPADFERDSGDYLMRQIGVWQQSDAQLLLGEALRQRAAKADDQTVNGQILAYLDPTGRYKEVELDFDRDTGLLRTLFLYPYNMTWQDCRRNFGEHVESTGANKGRTFYSYIDRRLDVLVDPDGKVVSLGMY